MYVCEDAYGSCNASTAQGTSTIIEVEEQYGVKVTGTWRYTEARVLLTAFRRMEVGIAAQLDISTQESRSILSQIFAGSTITRSSHDSPMYWIGVLAAVLTTGDVSSRPMANTFAPYYTIGQSGSVSFSFLDGPTIFIWDETFEYGILLAIDTIIHETGHLIDYNVSSGYPDILIGSASNMDLFDSVGYKNAPSEYALTSPWELFAETWTAYVNNSLKPEKQGAHITFFNSLLVQWR